MRISVVTDIHGNIEALARVADTAEQLIILGDLLDYVDYHDPTRGILAEVFGAEAVRIFANLRVRGDFPALRAFNAELWSTITDPVGTLLGIVRARYQAIAEVLPSTAVLTLGNVDVAEEWTAVAGDRLPYRDQEIVMIDGIRFGFVAGGASRYPPAPVIGSAAPWRPFLRHAADYRSAVAGLAQADVLCTHIPPDIPQLRYDTVPGRLEMAGPGIREYVEANRPVLSIFGHVHQPLATRTRQGRTEYVNAGHFQRHERPTVIDTELIRQQVPTARDRDLPDTSTLQNRYAAHHG